MVKPIRHIVKKKNKRKMYTEKKLKENILRK